MAKSETVHVRLDENDLDNVDNIARIGGERVSGRASAIRLAIALANEIMLLEESGGSYKMLDANGTEYKIRWLKP